MEIHSLRLPLVALALFSVHIHLDGQNASQSGDKPVMPLGGITGSLGGGGSIRGVVSTSAAIPISKAEITLRRLPGAGNYVSLTGAAGAFSFSGLPSGQYQILSVSRRGYASLAPGAVAPISIGTGQDILNVKITLQRFGAISGSIEDDEGNGLEGVPVQAFASSYAQDVRRFLIAGTAVTDDRGQYRIFDLPPGNYVVRAASRLSLSSRVIRVHSDRVDRTYSAVYYPNSQRLNDASPVRLTPEGEIPGVNFRLHSSEAYHIRGRVAGEAPLVGTVWLRSCGEGLLGEPLDQISGQLQAGAMYDLGGITPGEYCVGFQTNDVPTKYAEVRVAVKSEDVGPVDLIPRALADIPGNLTSERSEAIDFSRVSIMAQRMDGVGGRFSSKVDERGKFSLSNLKPGVYELWALGLPRGTYVKAITYGGSDVSQGIATVGMERGMLAFQLRSDASTMTGVVATEGGNAAAGRQVIIAPQGGFQNRRDLVKMVSTDRDGRFQITDIAPGEYEIVAIDGSDASLRSAEYRRFFEDRFDRVTVHPASHENVNVSLLSIQDFQRIRSQIP
jgi:hypothetical protein